MKLKASVLIYVKKNVLTSVIVYISPFSLTFSFFLPLFMFMSFRKYLFSGLIRSCFRSSMQLLTSDFNMLL